MGQEFLRDTNVDFLKFQAFAIEHKAAREEPSIPKRVDNKVGVRIGEGGGRL